jgi:hypothetical protein
MPTCTKTRAWAGAGAKAINKAATAKAHSPPSFGPADFFANFQDRKSIRFMVFVSSCLFEQRATTLRHSGKIYK